MGSANMSFSAFGGRQRENICYIDGDRAYNWYMSCYLTLRDNSTDQIFKEALLVADSGNVLRGNRLSTQGLLNITNAMEGHPDNLAPALYGGLTASMVDNGLPVTVNFPLHPGWEFLALIPDFDLPTSLARSVLPAQVSRADAIYNIAHGALVLKALELGDEKLLRNAMQDKLHQNYRKALIPDYEKIEALVRTTGAAFCLSGAGPTLLCITRHKDLQEKLSKKLHTITEQNWQMLPLHVEFQGAHVIRTE